MGRMLIVDDETPVLAALQRALRRHFGTQLDLQLEHDPVRALAQLRTRRFDLVLSDLRMPGMDGLAFLARAAQLQPDCVRLILSGSGDFATAQAAINELGVFRFLSKPWLDDALAEQVDAALVQAAAQRRQRAGAQRALAVARPAGEALSPQELERRRLEALEPGITEVRWGPAGEVLVSDLIDLDPAPPR